MIEIDINLLDILVLLFYSQLFIFRDVPLSFLIEQTLVVSLL